MQGHLNTQFKLNAKGTEEIQKDLDEVKAQNENLRVNIATLQSKPGKAELRQAQITEAAIRTMREQAPGFAPAWEQALRQAEDDYQAGESGLKKLVKKVIPAIGTTASSPSSSPVEAPVEEREEA